MDHIVKGAILYDNLNHRKVEVITSRSINHPTDMVEVMYENEKFEVPAIQLSPDSSNIQLAHETDSWPTKKLNQAQKEASRIAAEMAPD